MCNPNQASMDDAKSRKICKAVERSRDEVKALHAALGLTRLHRYCMNDLLLLRNNT